MTDCTVTIDGNDDQSQQHTGDREGFECVQNHTEDIWEKPTLKDDRSDGKWNAVDNHDDVEDR